MQQMQLVILIDCLNKCNELMLTRPAYLSKLNEMLALRGVRPVNDALLQTLIED